ncbi:MAG: hypothetical protein ACQES5_03215 [Thermodesulfobacteriota bacterium]
MAKKIKRQSPRKIFLELEDLYSRMQNEYIKIAADIGLDCATCSDNCCTSYFQHHTYIEWAYLWKGLKACDKGLRTRILERADSYVREEEKLISAGQRPDIMCPVNEEGWCALYPYRLMICRMHGIPNSLTTPDGRFMQFPGCFMTQELIKNKEKGPVMDRTPYYTQLAGLEMNFLGPKIKKLPRVNMTLARMIMAGPPKLTV